MSEPYSSSPPDSPIHPTPGPSTYLANGYGHPYSLVFPRALKSAPPPPPRFLEPSSQIHPYPQPRNFVHGEVKPLSTGKPGRRSWLIQGRHLPQWQAGKLTLPSAALSSPPFTGNSMPGIHVSLKHAAVRGQRKPAVVRGFPKPLSTGNSKLSPQGNQHRYPVTPSTPPPSVAPSSTQAAADSGPPAVAHSSPEALQCQPLKSTLQSPLLNSALRSSTLQCLCDCPIKPLLSQGVLFGG